MIYCANEGCIQDATTVRRTACQYEGMIAVCCSRSCADLVLDNIETLEDAVGQSAARLYMRQIQNYHLQEDTTVEDPFE